jgi:hypothetical protein
VTPSHTASHRAASFNLRPAPASRTSPPPPRAVPKDAEEEEYLENLFDTLCCCIMLPDNRNAFVAAEVGAPALGGRAWVAASARRPARSFQSLEATPSPRKRRSNHPACAAHSLSHACLAASSAQCARQGVELMFLLLKAKRASRYGAVKALDFACTR